MIRVDLSKCTGCRRCETVCAFFHTGRVNANLSRIKVLNLYEIGIDGPVVCVQCKERYCLKCPEGALSIGPSGQVIVSPTVCTLCGTCEKRCPIGAIERFNEIVHVCDACGGRPRCIEACTEEAITWVDDQDPPSLEHVKKETKKMAPVEKRYHLLKKLGLEIRKTWRRARA